MRRAVMTAVMWCAVAGIASGQNVPLKVAAGGTVTIGRHVPGGDRERLPSRLSRVKRWW
jgi:hypothetical protein